MEEEKKLICTYCNKKLLPFKKRQDFTTRSMHLGCWKEKIKDVCREEMQKQYLQTK